MKIDHFKAITLMELIIASIVVTVVMLGVVSANIILQKDSTSFSNKYYVTEVANTVLSSILADAAQVVGTASAPGIVIGAGTGDANTTCFYQDPNGIIQDTANGKWTCYTYYNPPSPNQYNIYRCTSNYSKGSNQGMKKCNTGAGSTLIGTASASPWLLTVFNNGLFSLTVDNCWNPAATDNSCCNPTNPDGSTNTNCPANPSNPFAEKKGSVSVAGYSAS